VSGHVLPRGTAGSTLRTDPSTCPIRVSPPCQSPRVSTPVSDRAVHRQAHRCAARL